MSLSANKVIRRKSAPTPKKLKVVDGAVHIHVGANLNYEASNIGYVMPATDVLNAEFAGIALEELNVAAADNTSDGTYEVLVLPRGAGDEVLMDVHDTITIANEGDPVYVYDDDDVGLSASVTNTTGGLVGIIRQFVSANKAWVQLVQHPTL
jgi:ABC-type uncharacterized transport system ATPase subunit